MHVSPAGFDRLARKRPGHLRPLDFPAQYRQQNIQQSFTAVGQRHERDRTPGDDVMNALPHGLGRLLRAERSFEGIRCNQYRNVPPALYRCTSFVNPGTRHW